MFEKLTEVDEALLKELEFTALLAIEDRPIPGLVRSLAWVEARRTERNWRLYELGLLLVRGRVLRHAALAPLAEELLRELKRRKSKWLQVLSEPAAPSPPVDLLPKRVVRGLLQEVRSQRRALLAGYDAGGRFELVPVIAFPSRGKKRLKVTVWGFKAGKIRWPSAAETRARRRRVRTSPA